MRISEAIKDLGRPVVFYPKLAAVFGIPESIFISHFVYWSDKGASPDGWIYKSAEEIEAETGLTYEQQRRIRKTLTGSQHTLKGHHRTARIFNEAVLEERHERMEHKIYFKVDFDALDRAFSQGQLFEDPVLGQLGKVKVAPGESPSGTWGKPISSITKSTTESTAKSIARKSAHSDFVKWWDETAQKIRKVKVAWSPADFRNLKIMLATYDKEKLEQLALYFLADPKFRKFAPTLRVFLSKGVMDGLKNVQNHEGFWNRIDFYSRSYFAGIKANMVIESGIPAVREEFKALTNNLAARFAVKYHE